MERIWQKKYDPGVPRTINPDQFTSLTELYDENLKIFSKEIAYINLGSSITYKQLDKYSKAMAAFLKYKCGLIKGDRVAIMLPNNLQYPVAVAGILRAGLTVVNVHPMHTPEALKKILEDCGAKCIIVWRDVADKLEGVIESTEIKDVIITDQEDLFGGLKVKFPKNDIGFLKNKTHSFKSAISIWYQWRFHKTPVDSSDIAFIQYKGTEIQSFKGVVLTHRNVLANSQQIITWTDSFFKRKFKAVTITAPLSFILSTVTGFFIFMRFGGSHILITDPKDTDQFIEEVKRHPFSTIIAYSLFFKKLLENKEFKKLDFSKIKYVFSGGGPIQESVVDNWNKMTQSLLLNSYGLAEACAIVTLDPLTKQWFDGSVGLPLPSTDLKICDANGGELPIGTRGEVWVHGPQVMKGYWNKPEETEKVLTKDGWLKTGDVGSIDQDGFLHIYDRLVDVMSFNNIQVYPNEIESILQEIEGIKEAAIIGIANEKNEFTIKAFVVKTKESLSTDEIISYCKKYLSSEKIPQEIKFIEKLPRTFSGRLIRNELR